MRSVRMKLPLGYRLQEEVRCFSAAQAQEVLLTKKQLRYSRAEYAGDQVQLSKHVIRCPYCRHKLLMTPRVINQRMGNEIYRDEKLPKKEILAWLAARPQEPLFLNSVVESVEGLSCPRCKNTLRPSDKSREVELRHCRHKVILRAEVLDLMELFSVPCLEWQEVEADFPLYEVACFNFRNGHTFLRLENAAGECLATRDLTTDKFAWTSGIIYDMIAKNTLVRRELKRMFCAEWGSPIPFYPSELGLNELRLLTMFIGYDREFYRTIPFAKGSMGVEESFRAVARKLRRAPELVALFERSRLPQMKSVRKFFFGEPGLFFYLAECERLWGIVMDPNHFLSLISGRYRYRLLSELHMRPVLADFFEDYALVKGTRKMLRLFRFHERELFELAANYASMSPHMRKREQKIWITQERSTRLGRLPYFSIPICNDSKKIRDCRIDDFEFYWLQSSIDFEEAGSALQNCLGSWGEYDTPVVCVRKNGKILAALEVRNRRVYQAFSARNQSLQKVEGLEKAYEKWRERNHIRGNDPSLSPVLFEDFALEEAELPF